jgi:retron-type reverse transcriptase
VAVLALEPEVEKVFHPDSYGYRPGRSPLDAIEVCRKRCWEKDWVVDLDVSKFFDSVRWDLALSAVSPPHGSEMDTVVCGTLAEGSDADA